ncbi:MAG: PilZ domain-containing protein [Gammaproteobacteria bacterium]|nr:PilZ domain-containing protein [Gammaproteobacteria bacterium]
MDMKDNRKLKRYTIKLKVFDQDNGKMLGYIEDISINGMNVKSTDRFPDMQELKVWFGADDGSESEKIELTVIKVWDAFTDTIPRLYNTGLHFISPSEQALDLLQKLIYELRGDFVSQWEESTFA